MDYGIAIDRLRPGAIYTHYQTYSDLLRTYSAENALPLPTDAELQQAYADWQMEEAIRLAQVTVQLGAKTQVANIPNFARWTEQQGLDWIAANIGDTPIDAVTSLTEAKVLMKKQAVVLAALWRVAKAFLNHTWPDLENID